MPKQLFAVVPSNTPDVWMVRYIAHSFPFSGTATGEVLFFGTEFECHTWATTMENA